MCFLNVFATAHSQITIRDQSGKESIIYDVSQAYSEKILFVTIAIFVFALAVILTLIIKVIKSVREQISN